MSDVSADLCSYYEEEARRCLRKELAGRRMTERCDDVAMIGHMTLPDFMREAYVGRGGVAESLAASGHHLAKRR